MIAAGPRPRIVVVGLGPAGRELVGEAAKTALSTSARAYLRTNRHPAAADFPDAVPLDRHYEQSSTFDEVYDAIVDELVSAAFDVATRTGSASSSTPAGSASSPFVAYAVPGSPLVAERTVALLRSHDRVTDGSVDVEVVPALSFLDLVWARLGVDPLDVGVRLVDATVFASERAGGRGPRLVAPRLVAPRLVAPRLVAPRLVAPHLVAPHLVAPHLVAQCWSKVLLSDVKLAVEPTEQTTATVLHHLGLPGELVRVVAWDDLDRGVEPDHLTSVWIPRLPDPTPVETVRLRDLPRVLRDRYGTRE